jgi:hypothetical protein
MTTTGHSTAGRTVATFGTTSGSKSVTGPSGSFNNPDDVDVVVTATGVPAGATLASVESDTAATLSVNATATGTVTATLGAELASETGFTGWVPTTAAQQADWTVASANSGVTPPEHLADGNTRVTQYVEH